MTGLSKSLRHALLTLSTLSLLSALSLTGCAGGDDPFLTGVDNQTPDNQTPGNQTPGNQTPGNQTPGNQTPGNQTEHECTDASDCADPAMDCVDDGTGRNICAIPDATACLADVDCAAGEACAVMVNDAGDALETICVAAQGGDAGASCSSHDDCRSHLCHGGQCAAPCGASAQCPGDFNICVTQDVTKDGVAGEANLCFEVPICSSPVDCPATEATCNLVFEGPDEELFPACGLRNPGQANLGATCDEPDACDSAFCWGSEDGTTGECSVFCEDAARDCGNGQVCVGFSDNISACLSSCERDADCAGGNVCHLTVNTAANAVETYCDGHFGDGATGDPCSSPADCATGLCLTMSYGTYTETFCAADGDCDTGFTCECPMDNPGCFTSEQICAQVTVQTRCSELCDPSHGDNDCQSPSHDLIRCSDDVTVTWSGGSDTVNACSTVFED